MQRAVRTLEAEGTGLKAEIADLAGKSVVTKSVRGSADEVRIAGDDAAHPEELGTVTREDAEGRRSPPGPVGQLPRSTN